jgi:chromosome segregation ATPase
MSEDVLKAISALHETLLPEIQRIVDDRMERTDGALATLGQDMVSHFDGVYTRLGRLEDEYQAMKAGLRRIEENMATVERRLAALEARVAGLDTRTGQVDEKLDQFAARAELDELKERVAEINARIAQLEQQLSRA